jgi:hypothetical protein
VLGVLEPSIRAHPERWKGHYLLSYILHRGGQPLLRPQCPPLNPIEEEMTLNVKALP